MSRVILVKANLGYIPAYQIMTKIIQEKDGSRKVIKSPIHSDAADHVAGLKRGAELAGQLLKGVGAVRCEQVGDAVQYDFVPGESWLSLLLKEANHGKQAYFAKWKAYAEKMTPRAEVIVPFAMSDSFERLFGNGDGFAGKPSYPAFPLDITPSNLIHTPEGEDIALDCEWVVDGPLPVSLMMYHAVHVTVMNHIHLREMATEEEVLAHLGVTEGLQQLKEAWKHFAAHITLCDENGKLYELRYAKPVEELADVKAASDYYRALSAQLQNAVEQLNALTGELREANVRLYETVTEKQRAIEEMFKQSEQVHSPFDTSNDHSAMEHEMEQLYNWRQVADEVSQNQSLSKAVEEKDRKIQSLETWLGQVKDRIAYLEKRSLRAERELYASHGREVQLLAEKSAMESSKSWRITAPLRKINSRLRRK